MSIDTFFTQSLEVLRVTAEGRDEIGGVITTESTTTLLGYLEPATTAASSSEDLANRNTQIGAWWAYVPIDTDVTGWDRVRYGTHTFDVDGPPEPFRHPTNPALNHQRVPLREVI